MIFQQQFAGLDNVPGFSFVKTNPLHILAQRLVHGRLLRSVPARAKGCLEQGVVDGEVGRHV